MSRVPWFLMLRIDGIDAYGPRYETAEAALSGALSYFDEFTTIGIHLCHEDGRTMQPISRVGIRRHLQVALFEERHGAAVAHPSSSPEVCPVHDVPLPADKTCEACIAIEPLAAKGYLR